MINAENIFIKFLKEKNLYERFLSFSNYNEESKREYFLSFYGSRALNSDTNIPYRVISNIITVINDSKPKNYYEYTSRNREIAFWDKISSEWSDYVCPRYSIAKNYVKLFYGEEIWFKRFIRFLKEYNINISKMDDYEFFSYILKCNFIHGLGYSLTQNKYIQGTEYPGWYLRQVWEDISKSEKFDELYNSKSYKNSPY